MSGHNVNDVMPAIDFFFFLFVFSCCGCLQAETLLAFNIKPHTVNNTLQALSGVSARSVGNKTPHSGHRNIIILSFR